MHRAEDLQSLEQEAWQLKNRFLAIIEPYRSDLWRFCLSLTKSPWDAEDLVQETLIKALAILGQVWQPLNPRSYLFRIATNTWLNQQRKRNKETLMDNAEELMQDTMPMSGMEVQESIEMLAGSLTPKQTVIVLVMDVFDFTAREAAELLTMSEGAVKSALHRARARLRKLRQTESRAMDIPPSEEKQTTVLTEQNSPEKARLVDRFIEAFNHRNLDMMASLLAEHAEWDGVHVGQEYGKETSIKHSLADDFKDPLLEKQFAKCEQLWGREVVAIYYNSESGPQLNDLIYLDTEEEHITMRKHYYFCQDLLAEAAKALNVTLQEDKKYKIES
ncbi:sigma-70 family RNA polymerase sigma factor [Paenibacillus sp. FSL M8-0334]|uniref:sigma-70 family RNA polymerase sigma factor n=1 Tax=Paenibacillus sp. FSL M8-0334 TaxID=2921623 RepID=UPI0030F66572